MSFGGLTFNGVADLERAILSKVANADEATRGATTDGLAAIVRQAQINSTGRPGPNVKTGAHRRGIKMTPVVRVGNLEWGGKAGPTMVYSRALERGGARNWPQGLKFPYFSPAFEFAKRIPIPTIFRRAWENAVKGAA